MATLELTKNTLDDTLKNHQMVLIDFWATWCGPCRAFAPVYETVSDKYPDIVFAKVNTEEEQTIAADYGIRAIPTLMIFREGVMVFNQAGALRAPDLEKVIERAKNLDMNKVRAEMAQA